MSSLKIGLVTSVNEESQLLIELLKSKGAELSYNITPQEINDSHVEDQQLNVWLLNVDDDSWDSAIDHLLDESEIPVFFSEPGTLSNHTHPEYWCSNLIDRLYEITGIQKDTNIEQEIADVATQVQNPEANLNQLDENLTSLNSSLDKLEVSTMGLPSSIAAELVSELETISPVLKEEPESLDLNSNSVNPTEEKTSTINPISSEQSEENIDEVKDEIELDQLDDFELEDFELTDDEQDLDSSVVTSEKIETEKNDDNLELELVEFEEQLEKLNDVDSSDTDLSSDDSSDLQVSVETNPEENKVNELAGELSLESLELDKSIENVQQALCFDSETTDSDAIDSDMGDSKISDVETSNKSVLEDDSSALGGLSLVPTDLSDTDTSSAKNSGKARFEIDDSEKLPHEIEQQKEHDENQPVPEVVEQEEELSGLSLTPMDINPDKGTSSSAEENISDDLTLDSVKDIEDDSQLALVEDEIVKTENSLEHTELAKEDYLDNSLSFNETDKAELLSELSLEELDTATNTSAMPDSTDEASSEVLRAEANAVSQETMDDAGLALEAGSELSLEPELTSATDLESESELELGLESQKAPEVDLDSELGLVSELDFDLDLESELELDSAFESEFDAEIESDSDINQEPELNLESDIELDSEVDSKGKLEPEFGPEIDITLEQDFEHEALIEEVNDDSVELADSADLTELDDFNIPMLDETASDIEFEEKQAIKEVQSLTPCWVIGASLGGPAAVKRFLQSVPADINGCFVITQHIDENFLPVLAEILTNNTPFEVTVANGSNEMRPGKVVIAPLKGKIVFLTDGSMLIDYSQKWSSPYSPCIDDVIEAVSHSYKELGGAIIFSGMGKDGLNGAKKMHQQGGAVWAQSKETCANSSMPEAIVDSGEADFVGTPEQLAENLTELLGCSNKIKVKN